MPARRLRVLVLAESLPYPTLKGGDLRTWQHVNALAAFADVGVFGLCSNDVRRHTAPDLPLACWTASTDPALTYPPPADRNLAARAWLLAPHGHPSDLLFSAGAACELSEALAHMRPDLVVVAGLWLHGYLETVRAAGCRVVLDCHNVEAAVARELAPTSVGQDLRARVVREILPARTAAIERAAIDAVDQVWVCSGEDERRMRALYDPRTPIAVVPNGVRVSDDDRSARRQPTAPVTLLFSGIFSYRPNAIAARFLVDELWPRLADAGAASRLLLVGPMPDDHMLAAAARDTRIVVTGAVPDVCPYLDAASAVVVPLFHGGGTHLKVLEAFAARVPVISTAKGAEGLDAIDGVHLLLAGSAEGFADAVVTLARDPTLAGRLTRNARALVAERYAWPIVGARVRDAVAALAP